MSSYKHMNTEYKLIDRVINILQIEKYDVILKGEKIGEEYKIITSNREMFTSKLSRLEHVFEVLKEMEIKY